MNQRWMVRTLRVMMVGGLALLLPRAMWAKGLPAYAAPEISWGAMHHSLTLRNGFVEITFDAVSHRVTHLSADHQGRGMFQKELLSGAGVWLTNDFGRQPASIHVEKRTPACSAVSARWPVLDNDASQAGLSLSLCAGDRGVHIEALLPHGSHLDGIQLALRQWFLLGIFRRGVVQYVSGQRQTFSSRDPLQLFYTIDRENGSVAVVPDEKMAPQEVSLVSGVGPADSGIVLSAEPRTATVDIWHSGLQIPEGSELSSDRHIGFMLYANDLAYPAHREDSRIDRLDAVRGQELAAYFTAIYSSAAGVLGSYQERGSAYPTLAHPSRHYGDAFNFFDPDSWEVVTALSYSGDPLLQREAREVLDRSGVSQSSDGQIPHHFEHGKPTFLSIAGSSQTGPNIFWVMAAMEYVEATGDQAWLRANYQRMRLATDWVMRRYDDHMKLVRADGPLFIDVFRRSGFTLDTNVFAYQLLARMSRVASLNGDEATASRYLSLRMKIREGLLQELWNGQDHFLTERHEDGSTRDFVDYDGNLGAVAFGVLTDKGDIEKLLARVDHGEHTHPGGYGTWVSERRYEKKDCYKDNDGDSDVAMARIWWLDLMARVRTGNRALFDAQLEKVQGDVLRDVWMPERFDADGRGAHNAFYHEYPEIFAMALRELRYGVSIDVSSISIRPFTDSSFVLLLGGLQISFRPEKVELRVPGSGPRIFNISGLLPGKTYALSGGSTLTTDAGGSVRFTADAGRQLVLALMPARKKQHTTISAGGMK